MSETTIRSITLRPPPGTRFSIFQHEVVLQFQTGREKEIIEFLRNWITSYIEPLVEFQAAKDAAKSGLVDAKTFQKQIIEKYQNTKDTIEVIGPVSPKAYEVPQETEFQVALCLSCKETPITKLSGLCDKCSEQAESDFKVKLEENAT